MPPHIITLDVLNHLISLDIAFFASLIAGFFIIVFGLMLFTENKSVKKWAKGFIVFVLILWILIDAVSFLGLTGFWLIPTFFLAFVLIDWTTRILLHNTKLAKYELMIIIVMFFAMTLFVNI